MPGAARSFRIPGGTLGLIYVVVFPTLLCAVGIYYSDPVAWKYSPWMLLAGPLAYLVARKRAPVSGSGGTSP